VTAEERIRARLDHRARSVQLEPGPTTLYEDMTELLDDYKNMCDLVGTMESLFTTLKTQIESRPRSIMPGDKARLRRAGIAIK
jgi:hypothetical protein